MSRTYKAMLHGDRVEWLDSPPESRDALKVYITLVEEAGRESSRERGQVMADALADLADRGTFSAITDPVAWQRSERHERGLPGRGGHATG